tara:strand:+ start:144 stop:446 length:303 start_codon:yes stop_codon:yes gene_type:complete
VKVGDLVKIKEESLGTAWSNSYSNLGVYVKDAAQDEGIPGHVAWVLFSNGKMIMLPFVDMEVIGEKNEEQGKVKCIGKTQSTFRAGHDPGHVEAQDNEVR